MAILMPRFSNFLRKFYNPFSHVFIFGNMFRESHGFVDMPFASGSNLLKKSRIWPKAFQWRIYYHRMWVQLSTTCSNYRSSPMGSSQLQSTTPSYGQWRQRRQIQLTGRTPHPTQGSTPLSFTYCTLQCGLQITRLAALSQPRTCEFRMPDQRTAGASTQGINCPI